MNERAPHRCRIGLDRSNRPAISVALPASAYYTQLGLARDGGGKHRAAIAGTGRRDARFLQPARIAGEAGEPRKIPTGKRTSNT